MSFAFRIPKGEGKRLSLVDAITGRIDLVRSSDLKVIGTATLTQVDPLDKTKGANASIILNPTFDDLLTTGRTTFIIAHRLSTVRSADMILVLRDGKIAEAGSFDELLRRGGMFATLYNSQFFDAPKPESQVATSAEPS